MELCNLHHITDRVVLRAYETLPESLLWITAQLEDGSKTDRIIAKQRVQANTLFGPLTAPEGVPPCPGKLDLGKHWPVFDDNKHQSTPVTRYLAVDDKTMCSWMILVRLAADKQQSNMDLVHHKGQLYFVTSRDIEMSEELKYYYSADYLSILMSELPGAQFPHVPDDLSSNEIIEADEMGCSAAEEEDHAEKSSPAANAASKMLMTMHRRPPQTMCDMDFTKTVTLNHGEKFSSPNKDALIDSENYVSLETAEQYCDPSTEFPYRVVLVYPPSLNHDMTLEYATKPLSYKISPCNSLYDSSEIHSGQAVQVTFSESLPEDIDQAMFLIAVSAKHGSSECPIVLYSCTQCKYNNVSFGEVKRHTLLHTEHKLHQCHTCGKSFHWSDALTQHMKCHTYRERTFLCKHCGRSFFSNAKLRRHEKSHTGENRRYPCINCTRVFTSSQHVNRHFTEVHLKVKAHQCHLCGSRFSQKQVLSRHLKTRHPAQSSEQTCENSKETLYKVRYGDVKTEHSEQGSEQA